MKFYKFIIFTSSIIFLIFSCHSPTEEYSEEINNLVLINADGTNRKILVDRFFGDERFTGSVEKYFVNNDSQILIKRWGEFVLINIDGSMAKEILIDMEVRRSCISPDRSKVAFIGTIDSTQEIYVMDYDGDNLHSITSTPNLQKRFPNFSHDGNLIVYSTIGAGKPTIDVVDISSGQVTTLFQDSIDGMNSAGGFLFPIFGRNDTLVFFLYEYWSENHVFHTALCSIDITGNNFNIVANDVSSLGNIKTASNSDKLFYLAGSNPRRLFSSDYNGLNKIVLGQTPISTIIEISPNDKKIVYSSIHSNLKEDVVIMNLDGSGRKVLSEGGTAAISTDGNRVLFVNWFWL